MKAISRNIHFSVMETALPKTRIQQTKFSHATVTLVNKWNSIATTICM